MKKTNKTYGIYISNSIECGTIAVGTKSDMIIKFNELKNNKEYDHIELNKWSTKYNMWEKIDSCNL